MTRKVICELYIITSDKKKYQPFKDIDMDFDCTESKKRKFNPFKINHNAVLALTVFYVAFSHLKQIELSNHIMRRENMAELT